MAMKACSQEAEQCTVLKGGNTFSLHGGTDALARDLVSDMNRW